MTSQFTVTKLVTVGTVTLGNGKDDPVAVAAKMAGTDFTDSLAHEDIENGAVQTYEFEMDEVEFSITLTANFKHTDHEGSRPEPIGDSWDDPIAE
jgi:hypothetical protein